MSSIGELVIGSIMHVKFKYLSSVGSCFDNYPPIYIYMYIHSAASGTVNPGGATGVLRNSDTIIRWSWISTSPANCPSSWTTGLKVSPSKPVMRSWLICTVKPDGNRELNFCWEQRMHNPHGLNFTSSVYLYITCCIPFPPCLQQHSCSYFANDPYWLLHYYTNRYCYLAHHTIAEVAQQSRESVIHSYLIPQLDRVCHPSLSI